MLNMFLNINLYLISLTPNLYSNLNRKNEKLLQSNLKYRLNSAQEKKKIKYKI